MEPFTTPDYARRPNSLSNEISSHEPGIHFVGSSFNENERKPQT